MPVFPLNSVCSQTVWHGGAHVSEALVSFRFESVVRQVFQSVLVLRLGIRLLWLVALACSADPGSVDSLIRKGDLQEKNGQYRESLDSYWAADRLAPNRADILARISIGYGELCDSSNFPEEKYRHTEAAFDYAKRAVRAGKGSAKAHLALAIAYGRKAEHASPRTQIESSKLIREEVTQSIELDSKDDYAWHVLGCWHLRMATLSPVLSALAKIFYGGLPPGSLGEAQECLKKSVELAPDCIAHHNELAKAYAAAGKKDLARAEWRKILKLTPSEPGDARVIREAKIRSR